MGLFTLDEFHNTKTHTKKNHLLGKVPLLIILVLTQLYF